MALSKAQGESSERELANAAAAVNCRFRCQLLSIQLSKPPLHSLQTLDCSEHA